MHLITMQIWYICVYVRSLYLQPKKLDSIPYLAVLRRLRCSVGLAQTVRKGETALHLAAFYGHEAAAHARARPPPVKDVRILSPCR